MRPWGSTRHLILPTLMLGIVAGCGGGGAGISAGGTRQINTLPYVGSVSYSPNDPILVRNRVYTITAKVVDPDIGDSVLQTEWDFGEGAPTKVVDGVSLTHSFTHEEPPPIRVRASDSSGNFGEWRSFTPVVDATPSPVRGSFISPAAAATFQADLGGDIRIPFTLRATTTTPNATIPAEGISFDPDDSTAQILSKQDNRDGTFTITVRYPAASTAGDRTVNPKAVVTDSASFGSDLILCPPITIQTRQFINNAPTINITNPSSPTVSGFTTKPMTLDFIVSDPDGDALNYTVDWGDGTPVLSGVVTGDTKAGVAVHLQHPYADTFTSATKSATVRLNATDNHSVSGTAVEQVRTFNIQFNDFPTAAITSPQASAFLPTLGDISGTIPPGFVDPPTANSPDIVVVPNGGKLKFASTATPPGSGEANLTYSWTFQGGTPATSAAPVPGEVVFSVAQGAVVPLLVELTVRDAFGRAAQDAPSKPSLKTYRKWVVVDGANTQTFQLSYMFRQKSDNNGTISLSPSRTAANGLGGSVQIFQDGVTNSYAASNPAGQAVVTIPVRSNLPFYAKLGAFGNDAIEYLVRIPNAPTGPFADPGLGGVLNPTASSFGFQNGIKPWNPTLQVVAGEGFAPESASAAERRLQGVAGPGMTVGLTPANTRYLDRLSVPLLPGDPLGAIQWTQTNNALAGFENIRANQLFGEWVVLGLNEAPKDALPAEMPADPTQAPGSASDFGFNLDYPTFQADNATSKTFTQKRIEVFRVPPSSTDPYDLNGAGWTSANTTIGVQPIQLPFTFSNFFNQTVWAPAGNAPLQGGLNGFPVPYDSNDPDRKPYKNKTASLQFIRQVFSFSEYLWSQVWARPLVLNQATLSYTDTIFALSGFPYFRRSNPAVWPKASAILPDNSAFDMNVTGGTDFDPATSPAAINGGTPAKTGIGRFYWTAFTPYYNISSGAVVSRTWKSTAAGDPPTTFTGNTGDSTNAFGFLPPQDVVVDKRGRNADGSLNGNPLGGYRVTWFNGTKDANGIPVPPDFWVVEVTTSTGKTNHFLIPGSFPAGQQRATDLLLTDARTFLPSGNSPDQGPDLGGNDTVAPGYCWFDIPAELRPDATTPGVSASIIVFAAKSILKNQPPAGARRLTAADWMDAIKTATANVAIKTNAGNLSYAHKIPFNFFWDIVVVNGPKTFVAP